MKEGIPMEAGRALDALVAEKVMGCKLVPWVYNRDDGSKQELGCGCDGTPHSDALVGGLLARYSTDIAAAWKVVERISTLTQIPDGRWVDLVVKVCATSCSPDGNFWCEIFDTSPMGYALADGKDQPAIEGVDCYGDTPAHAVCLAALNVVGARPGETVSDRG